MNCFNIRELQGILKRRFFNDLVNTTDHKDLLNQTLIGLRYKNNQNLLISPDMISFYNYNLTILPKIKNTIYGNIYSNNYSFNQKWLNLFPIDLSTITIKLNYTSNINIFLSEFSSIYTNKLNNLWYFISIDNYISTILSLKTIVNSNINMSIKLILNSEGLYNLYPNNNKLNYLSENITTSVDEVAKFTKLSEIANNYRHLQFTNPIVSYDFKTGNYIGIWDQLYPSLMLSYIEVARNIRKSS